MMLRGVLRYLRRAVLVLVMFAMAFGAGWLVTGQTPVYKLNAMTRDVPENLADALELHLETVEVLGRQNVSLMEVLQALGVKRGTAIYDIDLLAARDRIQNVGWVKSADIQRRLPDRLSITLVERIPFAVWQSEGRFHLVDKTGALILKDADGEWQHLPHVVGVGAVERLSEITDILAVDDVTSQLVKSWVRVGDRRWDVVLADGLVVQLPEEKPLDAWLRFSTLNTAYDIQNRPIELVDMRLADRVTFRLTDDAAKDFRLERQS